MTIHTPETLAEFMHEAFRKWCRTVGRTPVDDVPFRSLSYRRQEAFVGVASAILDELGGPVTLQAIRRKARAAQSRFDALARRFAA